MSYNLRNQNRQLDSVDIRILEQLNINARISIAELARAVDMSAPSVSERIKRLEESGVISGYKVEINPAALGYQLMAMVRIRPLPGQLRQVDALIREIPEFVECDKVTGDDCFIARLHLRDIGDLDPILERVTEIAETNTAIVKATSVKRRLPPWR